MTKFAGVELTDEAMEQARAWFVANAQACIDEAISGEVRVNDLESYIAWRREQMTAHTLGMNDHTFAFLQRAHTFQTGECVALLP